MYNQQPRGLSAGMSGGMPQYQGNLNPPANYWQGNQMMIPGAPPPSHGMGGAMQQKGQPPQDKMQGLMQLLMQDPEAMAELMKKLGMK